MDLEDRQAARTASGVDAELAGAGGVGAIRGRPGVPEPSEALVGPGELVALLKRELTPTAYKQWLAQGKAAKAPTKRSVWPHGR